MCGVRMHKHCIALDAGSSGAMHLRLEREADCKVLFSKLCEMVAHNKNVVKVASSASSQKHIGESADDADLLAAVFGGSGLGLGSAAESNGEGTADGPALSAYYPVILIPGLASSALDVVQSSDSAYVGKRVWIGLGSLAAGKMFSGGRKKKDREARKAAKQGSAGKDGEEDDDEDEVDVLAMMLGGAGRSLTIQAAPASGDLRSDNRWLRHVALHEDRDGFSDPPGIQTRAVPGLAGCAFLSKDKLSSPLSYVFGPLADALRAVGYVETDNLHAATYDWRCALPKLEEKYQYFSSLKKRIEEMRERTTRRVMLLAHSMGNRVTQYFFQWILLHHKGGQAWIDANIQAYMATGAPWLGAPKILRALTTGDRMDLDMFISHEEGHELVRSCGSLPCLLPVRPPKSNWRFPWKSNEWSVLRHGKKHLGPEQLFVLGRVESSTRQMELYDKDPVWKHILDRPPCKQIYNIIGVNLPTEFAYNLIEQSEGFVLDEDENSGMEKLITNPGFTYSRGVYYESEKFSPNAASSGDGTVPLQSLMYATTAWGATHVEILGAEHRAMLKDPVFLRKVLEILCTPQ